MLHSFYGGSDTSWAPPFDTCTYFRFPNFKFKTLFLFRNFSLSSPAPSPTSTSAPGPTSQPPGTCLIITQSLSAQNSQSASTTGFWMILPERLNTRLISGVATAKILRGKSTAMMTTGRVQAGTGSPVQLEPGCPPAHQVRKVPIHK